MKSVLFSAVLALAATVTTSTPVTAQQAAGPIVVQPNLSLVGTMNGTFNLPLGGALGFADGVLNLGTPQYSMHLELPDGPLFGNPATGTISGPLFGTLKPFPLTPGVDIFANVGGSWTWQPDTGNGFFRGDITLAPLPLQGTLVFPIGSMRGSFVDFPQVSPTGFDVLGSFKGLWTFFLQTATPPLPHGDPYPGPGGDDA